MSGPGEHYHYRSYLEDLLSYDPNAFKHQLQMQMWHFDKEGFLGDHVVHGANHNEGLVKRTTYFEVGRSVVMVGRLHSDIFNQCQALIPYVEMKITLSPNLDNVVLQTPAPLLNAAQIAYQVKIVKAYMRVHQFRLSPEAKNELFKVMQHSPVPYPIKHSRVHPVTIPANIADHLATISMSGPVPSRIVIGFVSQASFTGGYQANPFNFEHFGVNYIALKVNGKVFPTSGPIEPDYANNECVLPYYQLYEALTSIPPIKPIAITLDQFRQGFTLYAFDLTRQHNASSLDTYPEVAPVDLHVKFAAANANSIYAIIYDETDKYFLIDNSFNVINPI